MSFSNDFNYVIKSKKQSGDLELRNSAPTDDCFEFANEEKIKII